jgi:hypothetical protein
VTEIITALGNIRVIGVADKAPDFSLPDTMALNVSGNEDWTFHLVASDGTCYIRRDDFDAVFTIGPQDYNSLAGIGRKDLLAVAAGDPATPEKAGETPAQNPPLSKTGS